MSLQAEERLVAALAEAKRLMPAEEVENYVEVVGAYFINMVLISVGMGHNSPAESTVYIDPGEDEAARLVWHAFRAALRIGDQAESSEAMTEWVWGSPMGAVFQEVFRQRVSPTGAP